ncbi:MAG: NUDIX domain-containing protein [Candidatus Woesearchaeota archaeon]
MRKVISAIIIKNNELLLTQKKQTWILPGGKPNENETDLECLTREIAEELTDTKIHNLKFYKDFYDFAPHKKDLIQVKTYFAEINTTNPQPSNEINAISWANNSTYKKLSGATTQILNSLTKDKYLK